MRRAGRIFPVGKTATSVHRLCVVAGSSQLPLVAIAKSKEPKMNILEITKAECDFLEGVRFDWA
jgi:hypothetical protein